MGWEDREKMSEAPSGVSEWRVFLPKLPLPLERVDFPLAGGWDSAVPAESRLDPTEEERILWSGERERLEGDPSPSTMV